MEVDGMYENTPWEHLALWAPWLGLGALLLAILLYRLAKRGEAWDLDGALFKILIAQRVGALALSLATLGASFTIMWRPAHDAYPYPFGRLAIGVAIGSIVVAAAVGFTWRAWLESAIVYGTLTASAAAAVAIASFSHSIIAEGQVTAMVLPVSYILCALAASIIACLKQRDPVLHEIIGLLSFFALAYLATQRLPVVQFPDESAATYPVTGGFYIVALGRLARVWLLPVWGMLLGGVAAIAIGYLLASWYGIAIAAVGLSISGALDPLRLTSAESPLPRSTPA